jgi:hypothetical protein
MELFCYSISSYLIYYGQYVYDSTSTPDFGGAAV